MELTPLDVCDTYELREGVPASVKQLQFNKRCLGAGALGRLGQMFNPYRLTTRKLSVTGHVLLVGDCKAGAITDIVVPALLAKNRDSVVILPDISGECWDLTHCYREAQGDRCIRFAPGRSFHRDRAVSWNPVQEIRVHSAEDVQDARVIARALADYVESRCKRPELEPFLAALALHVRYKALVDQERLTYVLGQDSLAGMLALIVDPRHESLRALCSELASFQHGAHWSPAGVHPDVARICLELQDASDEVLEMVQNAAAGVLRQYADRYLARDTCTLDFSVRELMGGRDRGRVTFYFEVLPSDIDRFTPLMRMFHDLALAQNVALVQRLRPEARGALTGLRMVMEEVQWWADKARLKEVVGDAAGLRDCGVQYLLECSHLSAGDEAIWRGCGTRILLRSREGDPVMQQVSEWLSPDELAHCRVLAACGESGGVDAVVIQDEGIYPGKVNSCIRIRG